MAAGFALLLTATGGAEAQVALQVTAGLDGNVRPGRWAPVRVIATNSGAPVVGRLVLAVPGGQTALPVELPSTAKKRLEAAVVPQLPYTTFGMSADQASASLREGERTGSGGREVAGTRVPIQVLPESARLLVLCGEEAGGLRFLHGQSLGEAGWSVPLGQQAELQNGTTVVAHVPPGALPADEAGLDAADLLVVRDAAWQQLEPQQRRAVRQWTEMGGRLLLCGEDPRGFKDAEGRRLLPVEPAGPRPRPQLSAFPLPGRVPIRPAGGGRVLTVGARPRPEALVVLQEAGVPIVVSRPAGFGTVLWVGFDPFRVPPETAEGRRALWSFLIAHATGAETYDPAFPELTDVPAVVGPAQRLPHFPTPSTWMLGAFGLAYVGVFGPLYLWLLRRLRRTVRAWLLMPSLALLMTGAVLAVGTAWGQARVVFHAVTLLETMAGSSTAREQCLAVLFSPTNRAFAMEIDDPAPEVRLLDDNSTPEESVPAAPGAPYGAASPGSPAASGSLLRMPDLRDGDLSRWDRISLTLWKLRSIQADLAVDLGGSVRMELRERPGAGDTGPPRVAGQVVNDTPLPLKAAYLQFRGWRQPLGGLAPGGSAVVSPGGWQRPRRAAAGNAGAVAPGAAAGESQSDDWLAEAGSLLRTSPLRPEIVLVARGPGLPPPIRIPGVTRAPAAGIPEGAVLVVRLRLPAPAVPIGTPPSYHPGKAPPIRGGYVPGRSGGYPPPVSAPRYGR